MSDVYGLSFVAPLKKTVEGKKTYPFGLKRHRPAAVAESREQRYYVIFMK